MALDRRADESPIVGPLLVLLAHRRPDDGPVSGRDAPATDAQPERELAMIICDLAADLSPHAAPAAYAAYRAGGGPARLSSPADFAMAAAAQGHLLQFYSRRALEPDESAENKARSGKRLHDMLSQPLTLGRAGYLLDLLG